MHWWLQLNILSLKLRLFSLKLSVRRAVNSSKERWRKKITKAQDKVRLSRRKAVRAAKDRILPSLPGVSKLKLPSPPAPHLVCTNLPPSDFECIHVRKAIADAESTLSHLKEKLDRRIKAGQTNAGWEAVTRHKIGQAKRFIHQQQGIISPLRRLPNEILQEIFTWATTRFPPYRPPYVWELPWQLSQVCRHWRVNALSLSTLWSVLPVLRLKKSRALIKRQVEYVCELLQRSGQAPIDISIKSTSYNYKSHPTLTLLVAHSNRWQSLTIEATPVVLTGLSDVKGQLASLKSLSLQTPWHSYSDGPLTIMDTFEVAPQLQTVALSGPFAGEMKLPFAQLIHYKERRTPLNHTSNVFSSLSLLQSLTLLELSDHTIFPRITLPHLVKLQVRFDYESTGRSFDNLTLPAIEDIRIASSLGNLMPRLGALLARSDIPSRLKTLWLRTDFVEPGDLSSLLRLTPNLVHLDTTLTRANNFVDVASLAYKETSMPLVPHLETCQFFIEDPVSSDTAQALNELAGYRCELESNTSDDESYLLPGQIRPLKSLSIYADKYSTVWIHRQQAELENWTTSMTSVKLAILKSQLALEIPDLMRFGYFIRPAISREKPLGKKGVERVSTILNAVDAVDITDPIHIYAVGIHLTLRNLTEMQYSPESAESNLGKRAKEILAKWEPVLLKYLSRRCWASKGPFCIGYVPANDAIRNSPDALDIVYGLKGEMYYPEAFWPTYMTYNDTWPL